MAKKAARGKVASKKRKYSRSAGSDVENEMRRYKKGTAKSGRGGKGGKVKSERRALVTAWSKAGRMGKKSRKSRRVNLSRAIQRNDGRRLRLNQSLTVGDQRWTGIELKATGRK